MKPLFAKKVKFSDLQEQLQSHFSLTQFSQYSINHLVRDVFPNVVSKQVGKSKHRYFFGMGQNTPISASQSDASVISSPSTGQASAMESVNVAELLLKISQLEDRMKQLERESHSSMIQQADSILQHKSTITHGPDTIDNFHGFNMDSVVAELEKQAPELCQLFKMIGDIKRNAAEDETTTEGIKAIILCSLCSLLNARSSRAKGLQLMISLMLIARATARQVSHIHVAESHLYMRIIMHVYCTLDNCSLEPHWFVHVIYFDMELSNEAHH